MNILAADACTSVLTIAVWSDGRVLAETIVDCGRTHTERLMETADWVLRESALRLTDVDALAAAAGPGSFTGLRVGLAAWKGLALGAGLPLVAVPTFDAMARLVPLEDGLLCPLLDARMKEVFGAAYRFEDGRRHRLMPDRVCPVEAILADLGGPALFLGDGAVMYRYRIRAAAPGARFVEGHLGVPRASAVAAEAAALLEAGAPTDPGAAMPVYLRKSQAEESRARRAAEAPSHESA